jgi:hypothetical protein
LRTYLTMKNALLSPLILAAALLPIGCTEKDSSTTPTAAVDTSKSESAFASAEASVKAGYDKVATAIKNTDWSAATTAVQEQKATLRTLSDDIKAKAAAATAQAKEKAAQLAEDAKKAGAKAVDEAGKLAEKAKEATSKAAQDASKAAADLLPKK